MKKVWAVFRHSPSIRMMDFFETKIEAIEDLCSRKTNWPGLRFWIQKVWMDAQDVKIRTEQRLKARMMKP